MSKQMQYSITTTPITPTLTKLEYFALIISAQCEGQRDLWADKAIDKAQELIAALDKVQSQEQSRG